MSDYQAIYDAVRSRFSGGDISSVAERVMWEAFDMGRAKDVIAQEASVAFAEMARPCILFKPVLSMDGNMWCALYGEDLVVGVAGFGETPDKAMRAFDQAWLTEKSNPPGRAQVSQ